MFIVFYLSGESKELTDEISDIAESFESKEVTEEFFNSSIFYEDRDVFN